MQLGLERNLTFKQTKLFSRLFFIACNNLGLYFDPCDPQPFSPHCFSLLVWVRGAAEGIQAALWFIASQVQCVQLALLSKPRRSAETAHATQHPVPAFLSEGCRA